LNVSAKNEKGLLLKGRVNIGNHIPIKLRQARKIGKHVTLTRFRLKRNVPTFAAKKRIISAA